MGVTMLQYWQRGIVGPVAALAVVQIVVVALALLLGPASSGECAVPDIRVENLSKSFSGNKVLDDISFTVREKEFVTLLGPSGCGKTTTLMSIAGFQTPTLVGSPAATPRSSTTRPASTSRPNGATWGSCSSRTRSGRT